MNNSPEKSHHHLIMISIGAFIISFSPIYVKVIHVAPTLTGFYRMLFASLILIPLAWLKKEPLWLNRFSFYLTALAGFFFALDLIFWHRSIHYVGPGLATLLGNFQVFFMAVFGIFVLREHLTFRFLLSIPLALMGLVMIVGLNWSQLSDSYKLGVLFGLLTAICYAAYILTLRFSQSLEQTLSPTANMAHIAWTTALFLGVVGYFQGENFSIPNSQSLFFLLLYGVMTQVVGWVLISKALPWVKASRAGLILLLQPALAFVWDILFFDRPFTIVELAGAALALGAIYIGSLPKK